MPNYLENILNHLSDEEKNEIKLNNLYLPEKLALLLLKRVHTNNLQDLVNLIKKTVPPSIYPKTDEKINQLFFKIEKEPNLLFDRNIQPKIEHFVNKRFEKDKQVVLEKTYDVSKLIVLMEDYLSEVISGSGLDPKNILNIKEKIESINLKENTLEALTKLQNELIVATSTVEKEMSNIKNKLQIGKTKVQELEERIKILGEELDKAKIENTKDHLTGLLIRRAFDQEVRKLETQYDINKTKYAIIFFDLDDFKKLNDTYGHHCGDTILSTFGKILNTLVEKTNIVGRYGGEEFVVIFNFDSNSELIQFLKRIHNIVTEKRFRYEDKKIKVTFSAGVTIRNNYDTYEDALREADNLLYKAKKNGKNRIALENDLVIV